MAPTEARQRDTSKQKDEVKEGEGKKNKNNKKKQKHTTPGIRWSSPTQLLARPYPA